MSRTLSLHPLSLVLGIVCSAVCLLSMSQVMPVVHHLQVGYGPDPRDMVQLREGTSYTVPAGRILVVTGLGSTDGFTGCTAFVTELLVNGQVQLRSAVMSCTGATVETTVAPVPSGMTISAGDIVDIVGPSPGSGSGRAWGYLAPQ